MEQVQMEYLEMDIWKVNQFMNWSNLREGGVKTLLM